MTVILGTRAARPQSQRYQATLNRRIIRAARSLRARRPRSQEQRRDKEAPVVLSCGEGS